MEIIDLGAAEQLVADQLNCLGVEVEYADVGIDHLSNYTEVVLPYEGEYSDDAEIDFSILEAVGLIRRVNVDFDVLGKYSFTLNYYHLTHLGFVFAEACGIVQDIGVRSLFMNSKNIEVTLTDDSKYSLPMSLFPKLEKASAAQRSEFEITYISVRWPKIEHEIAVREIIENYSDNKIIGT